MSSTLGKLVQLLLEERFGEVIGSIANYLHNHGPSPLLYIKRATTCSLAKLKEALCVMIKYDLVSYAPNRNPHIANYTLLHDKVLVFLRHPSYIALIKSKFGDETEILLQEIILNGYETMSEVIIKTYRRLEEEEKNHASFVQLRDMFFSLIVAKYVQRIARDSQGEKAVPTLQLTDAEKFNKPEIDVKLLADRVAGKSHADFPDKHVYWRINPDRFHQDMRDALIVSAMTKKLDAETGELISVLLEQMYIRTEPWENVSNPVPMLEVKEIVRKRNRCPNLHVYFDSYVSVVEQDRSCFLIKSGEASGGSYALNMKEMFTLLTWDTIEQIVVEKFGSKAARIFRLIKIKGYIEPDNLQQLAMIPAKEAKRISYQLLEENFVDIHELRKPIAMGASKSFTLFHINLARVVRMVLELCYKTLFNTLTRKFHTLDVHKRLIDKQQKVKMILLALKSQAASEEELQDIEDMLTPPERETLQAIEQELCKLNALEFEINDTMFILQLFLAYDK